jgi:uncharacterized phage infection (PIP) family protein YhgE
VKDDIIRRLDALRRAVDNGRSVPMSASVMINRADFNELIAELEMTIDGTLSHATEVVGDRDAVLSAGVDQAEEIVREAENRREDLVSDTDVFRLANLRAEEIRVDAEKAASALRAETDEYVESKLANFEDTLARTVGSVRTGLAQLSGESPPELDEEMRVETDEYVAAKLADFEATLVDLIGLVQRGRAQLTGGHSHLLGDDTDVNEIVLSEHFDR